jgi:DNA-binding transcriptional ArsR family regulator
MAERILTEEDKTRIISSVYSNVKKLKIATSIHALKESTADELSGRTGIKANLITTYLKEMENAGIMETRRESYFIYYRLTSFGEKIVTLFN